ncbi:prolyl aminopeptidase (secreted protein) [Pochonia chlamydosporia 170]|uniref:Prolyl aminopeptidase (Secreted protein) n=1 Tax=Pochonia chlamydosporia 170 TaxID=1380566 RepID=A0A179FJQ0_METCM|nr:prolyl aminopeptidase (secreted protein) [Pochonia chlamydosporia 170]OAQ65491.1 prolyl aminopeptidase (secreted protein) [Pochonia chlamydosporia 170]
MRHIVYFSALVATIIAPPVSAIQVANFPVTKDLAESYGCGEDCQKVLNKTLAIDISTVGRDFDVDFYSTAANFTHSKAGDLLKLTPLDPNSLDDRAGTTVYRMQYSSKDLDGSTVPATGFIAFPYTASFKQRGGDTRHHDKYRVVAVAHGTIGTQYGCAPSNGPGLFDYDTWKPLLERGYAVVATDYAGLGNNYTSHKYLSFRAQASDLYYSVVAARQAFGGSLTKDWMSIGYSYGGGAAWKLAESQYVKNDENYLGTVAVGPVISLDMVLDKNAKRDMLSHLPLVAPAIKAAIPSYKENMLSDKMRKRMELANKAQVCALSVLGLSLDLALEDIYSKEGLEKDKPVLLQWVKDNSPAQGDKSPAPILLIQGLNDTTAPLEVTERAWRNTCASGSEVHLSLYSGMDHSPAASAGGPEFMSWIDDQFLKAKGGKSNCTRVTREPFDAKYVKAPPEVSW